MVNSMTGFAARSGHFGGASWAWEVRSVNARGLDLRLRVPEAIEGVEAALRAELRKRFVRGNITVSLRLERSEGAATVCLDEVQLARMITAARKVEQAAAQAGLHLRATSAGEILALRGVVEARAQEGGDNAGLSAALSDDIAMLLDDFAAMRAAEGAALARLLSGYLDAAERLVGTARQLAEARKPQVAKALGENLARVMAGASEADPARVAQELALLAIKSDVSEEIERLHTHIGAARGVLQSSGAVGRKLDFLMQEFNREANTLCAKSASSELTACALDLKSTIDQMREQVQNVE